MTLTCLTECNPQHASRSHYSQRHNYSWNESDHVLALTNESLRKKSVLAWKLVKAAFTLHLTLSVWQVSVLLKSMQYIWDYILPSETQTSWDIHLVWSFLMNTLIFNINIINKMYYNFSMIYLNFLLLLTIIIIYNNNNFIFIII